MDSTVRSASVHPLALGIVPTISDRTVRFELTEAANLYVEIEGEEDEPLFLFANPLEAEPPPNPEDPGVLYFGPGVHDLSLIHI